MNYKYETHLHTAQGSACSCMTGAEAAEFFKSLGYTGIFITDHFFNGNTAVPKMENWEKRVSLFCEGYKDAYKKGWEIGLDVFFAFEFQYSGTHFLVYNLDEDWIKSHPEIMDLRPVDFLNFVKSEGGLVIQAHPFREAVYIEFMRLFPRHVDAVEYMNSSDTEDFRKMAKMYADHYRLPGFAGSDIHSTARKSLGGLEFETRITDSAHFVELFKKGDYKLFIDEY
ncbi:MAG: PHP-associated domain-containing protein [Monoglobales bacterium]